MDIYLTDLRDVRSDSDLISLYSHDLSASEAARYAHMKSDNRRLQFLTGRALIHAVCGISPDLSPAGKPIVSNGYISLSHSGPYVVLAHADSPVGVDIEDTTTPRDFTRLSRRLGFPPPSDALSFYGYFTRSEALLKLAETSAKMSSFFYSIDTFILCIITLNNNEKINFKKITPLRSQSDFQPPRLFLEGLS